MPHPPTIARPASPVLDRRSTLDGATGTSERAKLAELAAQFESMLMLEMIKQMRRSLLDEESQEGGLGADTLGSTIDSELAQHLARAGGLGLQPGMLEAWDRQTSTPPRASPADVASLMAPIVARPVALSATRPVVAPDFGGHSAPFDTPALDMSAAVSSLYGWRRDPFKRIAKFHGGIDLAASYGTDVPAAADGTVTRAGEQGSYGLTVVVRHPNGYETRYAHLSSLDVAEGSPVARGQRIGRVGSTGRSTGPHLHFEVTQAGRRVDPERFVRNLTGDTKGQ